MVLAQRRQLAIYQEQLQSLKHGWLSRWHRWGLKHKIQDSKAISKNEAIEAQNNETLQQDIEKTDAALTTWLKTTLLRDLNILPSVDNETGLKDLPDVALAMLLVSESLANDNPTAILTTWQTTPSWQSAATLRTAFAPSNWQRWVAEPKATLSKWIFAFERNDTLRRLNIVWDIQNQAQPELQKWLRELSDFPEILPAQLPQAWETAQNQAERLAQHLIALAQPQATAYHGALTAVILGDVAAQLDTKITTWLQQQTRTTVNELLTIYETRIYRFEQIAALIYEFPPASQEVLARDVHDWAQVYLTEILEGEATTEKIWEMLERARIGLNSLTLDLPENWEETLGEKLWKDLATSIWGLAELIQHGKQPEPDSKWLPLETWLTTFAGWLSKLPTAAECQAILNPKAAIAQPFFDPNQQRLRVLWLDKYSLTLRELPKNCALKTDWDKIMQEWERGYQELRIGKSPDAIWEEVMRAEPVINFAATLQAWATEFEQLSVIFPAPLGQLPWESLALLDNIDTSFTELSEKLVREASIAHWQSTQIAPPPQPSTWVAYNPAHHDKDCECTAAQWVAQHFNTQADTPSLFKALSGFANNRHIHLSTHAKFNPFDPIRSFLEINAGQNMPLWMLTTITTSAEFVMLCACESNLAGKATANLLTPIGIAP
jgi:hypothetical protein